MKRFFFTLALLVAALALAAPAQAQQDSTEVIVINRTDLEVIIDPAGPVRRFRGDSLQFSAVAVDTVSGDTLSVEFVWSSTNPSVLTIDSQTGMAYFNNRGNAQVVVEVVQLVGMIAAVMQQDGSFTEVYTSSRAGYYQQIGYTPPGAVVGMNAWRKFCWYTYDTLGRVTLAGGDEPVEYALNVTADDGEVWDYVSQGGPALLVTAHNPGVAMTPPPIHNCPDPSAVAFAEFTMPELPAAAFVSR